MVEDMGGGLGAHADALLRYFVRLVADELRGRDVSLVPGSTSPLGVRKHNAAVRRRLAEHERGELPISGASIVNKRHYLTQEALAEELGRPSGPTVVKAKRRGPDGSPDDEEQAAYEGVMSRYKGPKQ